MKRAFFLTLALLSSCKSIPSSAPASVSQAPLPNQRLSNPSSPNYPPEAVAQFIQGCSAGHPPSMQNTCRCIIQGIQAQYTYAQYQALAQAGKINSEGQNIISSCVDSTMPIEAPPAPLPSATNRPITQANNSTPYIVGQDGVFLGLAFNNPVDQKSICNQVGAYGSQVQPTSIRNQVGKYGSQISDLSAYNTYARKPPQVIQNGQLIGILTKNSQLQGGTDPDVFFLNICGVQP